MLYFIVLPDELRDYINGIICNYLSLKKKKGRIVGKQNSHTSSPQLACVFG